MPKSNPKQVLFSKGIDDYFTGIHSAYKFVLLFFKEAFKPPFHFKEVINQCYEVGLKSLPLITTAGFALQSFVDYNKRIFVAIPNVLQANPVAV